MTEVRMMTTHPCYLQGLPVEPGTEVALTPADAQALIDSGRGQLLDPTDAEPLRTALAEAFQRAAQAQPHFGQSPEAAAEAVHELARSHRPRRGIGFVLPDRD